MNNTIDYIDVHAHILPGVDDGSGSMEETIRMLQIANKQQIRIIIATPHYAVGAKNLPAEELVTIKDRVQVEAVKINKDMQILLGNELFYSDSILEALKSGKALTLAGSRYALVEFSTRDSYDTMYKGLGNLIRAGYAPIIAHIERYHCFEKKEYLISDLIELGCYIQMNSDSLCGGIFNTEAKSNRKLVSEGLVHFIGSDCHDDKIRVPNMISTVEILQKKCDEGLVNMIFLKNPVSVLENTYI